MTAEHLSDGPHYPYRTSLRRYVAEKWGAADDIENDESVSENSESESVAGHFRAALSNAASKLRFPLRHKEKTPDSVRTADSDDDSDDGRSLISALSKTANTISAKLLRGTGLIKTSSQRSLAEQPSDDSNTQALMGTEISGMTLKLLQHDDGDNGSSTSSSDSFNDPFDVAPPNEMRQGTTDDAAMLSTHRHSGDHKRRPTKSKSASSGGHSGKSKHSTRSKQCSHGEKEEHSDKQRKERCIDHDAVAKGPHSKTPHRTPPRCRGVGRTKSLNKDHKHREHRVNPTKITAEHKGEVSGGKERRRGVHRTSSVQREDRDPKLRDHRGAQTTVAMETICTRNNSNDDEKRRGVLRAKSHDLAHMQKRVERGAGASNQSPLLEDEYYDNRGKIRLNRSLAQKRSV